MNTAEYIQELKNDIHDEQARCNSLLRENMILREQLERAKSCGNCKHIRRTETPYNNADKLYACKKGGFSMGLCEEWELNQ